MKKLVYLLTLIALIQFVNASTYEQEFYLNENKANIVININHEQETRFNFYLDLPKDVKDAKIYLDNQENKFEVRQAELTNFVNVYGKATNIKIEYSSSYYLDHSSKYYFTAEVNPVLDGDLIIKVILPEGATLDRLYHNDNQGSVYPKPSKLETNGKNLIIIWENKAESYKEFPMFLVYNYKNFNYLILIVSLLMILVIVYLIFKTVKKRKLKIKKVKVDNIEKHLKENEKLIVSILKQKKECSQSTLVTLTNMSKASLSRLLDDLEERNIIIKERYKNKNIIKLKRL